MASANPFDLLLDDDSDDLSQLVAAQEKKIAARKPAQSPAPATASKMPSKPLPPAQAVREAKSAAAAPRGGGGGRGGPGRGRGGRGGPGGRDFGNGSANGYGGGCGGGGYGAPDRGKAVLGVLQVGGGGNVATTSLISPLNSDRLMDTGFEEA